MSDEATIKPLAGDNPIREPEQDVLGRAEVAARFAQQVLDLNASEGAAVGVFGPWGSGKTSFVNLARKMFEEQSVPVLEFNPWMFSGAEQLIGRFFAELSSEMEERDDLQTVAAKIRDYSGAFVGPAAALAGLIGGKLAEELVKAFVASAGPSESIRQLRDKAANVLRDRAKPVIVILDDVDRLSGQEIREVFKLVRLTASFPNLVYIVACDRLRVEQALEERGLPGRDYLEKIIQFPYNLPETPRSAIREQARAAIAPLDPYDDGRHFDIFLRIVEPLLQTMRDIRRYEVAIRSTAINLEGKIQISDVLGLEAVRLFLPDVFQRLHGAVDILTVTSNYRSMERELKRDGLRPPDDRISPEEPDDPVSPSKTWFDEWIEAAGPQRRVVHAMIDNLFPAAAREPGEIPEDPGGLAEELLQKRRVGHEDILRFYLERVPGGDIPAYEDAERAFKLMADRDQLDKFLRGLDPSRRAEVVSHLTGFGNRFGLEHVDPGCIVLLNLLTDLPDPEALLRARTIIAVSRVVVALLKVLSGPSAVGAAAGRILPELQTLATKVQFVRLIGHRENFDGEKLVSEDTANRLEASLCGEIHEHLAAGSIGESYLAWVLGFPARVGRPPPDIPDTPESTFKMLRSALTRMSGDVDGLDWQDALVPAYGDETVLKERIGDLRDCFNKLRSEQIESWDMSLAEAEELLELAEKYAAGQPPD
ncbi:MAG: P-loop NTPase fold protein [Rhodospirillaceae bacterium]|nr:P-loop NTPase fold protein [Rhodospirillaceae bacterium]MCY4065830.1 P-loop NTPase fold protein [Rhodospirillaceae bacterium]